MNQKRVELGLEPLIMDQQATNIARYKSNDMAQRQYFSHANTSGKHVRDLEDTIGVSYNAVNENIAMSDSPEGTYMYNNVLYKNMSLNTPEYKTFTANRIFNSLWDSGLHKANMMDADSKYVGIGVIYNKYTKTYYATQDFFS